MNRYAVSQISFHDNELTSTIVSAYDAQIALLQGLCVLISMSTGDTLESALESRWQEDEYLSRMADWSIEQIKDEVFNGDAACNVIEIPEIEQ
jgi:hypothetical protein